MYWLLQYAGATIFAAAFLLFIIVPMVPDWWQYQIKMMLYYFKLLLDGFIVTFLALPRPRNLDNYKYPMTLIALSRWLLGIRFRINRPEALKQVKGSYVLVSNHQSSIDLIGVGVMWPYDCTIVSKKSLLFAGWFGLAAWLCGCVFVSRGRQSAQAEMRRLAARMAREGETTRVWIFPEGTRHSGEELGEFKKGAFHLAVQAQVPIVPIVFSNYSSFYSKRAGIFRSGVVDVAVLDPVATVGLAEGDVSGLTLRVQEAMNAEFRRISQQAGKAE